MEGFKNLVIAWLEKVWALIKSAPAVYAYGVATGLVLGWVF